jgi:hypothetical protein
MEGDSMAPPCGTSISTIHQILEYLQLDTNDILYDLGCGDGRVCFEAWHKYHCTTIGIEVEADLVERAQTLRTKLSTAAAAAVSTSGQELSSLSVTDLPQIYCMDLRQIFREWMVTVTTSNDDKHQQQQEHDIKHHNHTASNIFPLPTIIFLYLLPEALLEMEPSLVKLLSIAPKNCRIVCNTWGIPNWKPIQVKNLPATSAVGVSTTIHVYTIDSVPHKHSET